MFLITLQIAGFLCNPKLEENWAKWCAGAEGAVCHPPDERMDYCDFTVGVICPSHCERVTGIIILQTWGDVTGPFHCRERAVNQFLI